MDETRPSRSWTQAQKDALREKWTPEKRAELSLKMQEYWAENQPPTKGMKHTPESIAKMRTSQAAARARKAAAAVS